MSHHRPPRIYYEAKMIRRIIGLIWGRMNLGETQADPVYHALLARYRTLKKSRH